MLDEVREQNAMEILMQLLAEAVKRLAVRMG